jgi:hypothetical protein
MWHGEAGEETLCGATQLRLAVARQKPFNRPLEDRLAWFQDKFGWGYE